MVEASLVILGVEPRGGNSLVLSRLLLWEQSKWFKDRRRRSGGKVMVDADDSSTPAWPRGSTSYQV